MPAPFRAALAKLGAEELVVRRSSHSPCLEFWPRPTFLAEVDNRIAALDPFSPDFETRSRRLVARVYPVQPDAEGRAGLPRELLEPLAPGAEIVFTGRMKFFQLWDAVRFAEVEAADAAGEAAA